MHIYTYKTKTIEGFIITGQMQAESRKLAVAAIKHKGLYILSVNQLSKLSVVFKNDLCFFKNHVNLKEKTLFTQQLATLLGAGVRLSVALHTLSKQTENKFFASVLEQVHMDVEDSSSLSHAMAKYPRVFPNVYTAIISAAEQSGALAKTLKNLSGQLKSIKEKKS